MKPSSHSTLPNATLQIGIRNPMSAIIHSSQNETKQKDKGNKNDEVLRYISVKNNLFWFTALCLFSLFTFVA